MSKQKIDAAIVGGGIAGIWALNLLRGRGYNVALLEAGKLGMDQTFASQGMIHGGLKYALSGRVNGASEAIADMPRRWRACLQGAEALGATQGAEARHSAVESTADVDLRGCRLLSEHYYMFAAGRTLGRLTSFFASRALRGRIDKLPEDQWPEAFKGFDGTVYLLNDFVIDTPNLLTHLLHGHESVAFCCEANGQTINANPSGGYDILLDDTTLHATQLISCAGNGSAALMEALGVAELEVQQRPLKQVIVKPKHNTPMYAHCLTHIKGPEPRLTITTHNSDGREVWYLGGQLATTGVHRSDAEQITFAQAELQACLPWLDWREAEYSVLTVNRAEPKQTSGLKPDAAYVARVGDFIQCFPTKLTLAPDMGDRLLQVLSPAQHNKPISSHHPTARLAAPPW